MCEEKAICGFCKQEIELKDLIQKHTELYGIMECAQENLRTTRDGIHDIVYELYPTVNRDNITELIEDDDIAAFVSAWII